ncbi:MAG: hypothetical protein R3C44_19850 [Chloroflexota bacterium]
MEWRRFFKRPANIVSVGLILIFVLMAIFAPVLAPPVDPDIPWPFKNVTQTRQRQPFPPAEEWMLGTTPQIVNMPQYGFMPDQDASYQWDVYYTLIWGSRSALWFGLVVTGVTAIIGLLVGVISGYVGGRTSLVTMRITDAFWPFRPLPVSG